ncbi:5-formyltetrahydrofolate cyclo-ligase [Acidomonas methanolica]|uniref:5-formyltetrahydrofolate cyclo-ligase n=1 Tax=Acidomonas methanolica TaxID=437 RepID=UPI00211A2D82|nr:5-formyltetrahydrofolate cyclo-ligase [Acidomonas methanolica]MCQ9156002.1 5-formyltetrahydrofolate cyclo-ligase [Acidomonas methanolica]
MVVPHSLDDEKRWLRAGMRKRRRESPPAAEDEARLAGMIARALESFPARRIGGVWPLPGEADLRALWRDLHERGRSVLLPETTPRAAPLLFRHWSPDVRMLEGRFGTLHPEGEIGVPDLVLVPLLAFDRRLNRLGYGGGYYDRTLSSVRCPAIGYAFSWQEVPEVPVGEHDWKLDGVVTEREMILRCDKED